MSDRGSGFGAFLVGGLIGAAIGLLYAPRSGRETREILVGEGEEMMDRATTAIRDAQDKALMAIRDTQSRLETLNTEAKDRINKLQEIAGSTMEEQKQSLQKGYSEAKKVVKDAEQDAKETAKDIRKDVERDLSEPETTTSTRTSSRG